MTAHEVSDLQRTYGNRSTIQLLKANPSPSTSIQRDVEIDGAGLKSFDDLLAMDGVTDQINTSGVPIANARQMVDAMLGYPGFTYRWTVAEMIDRLPQIWVRFKGGGGPMGTSGPEIQIAQVADLMHHRVIEKGIKVVGRGTIHARLAGAGLNPESAIALSNHISDHPGIAEFIKSKGVQVKFNSNVAKGMRGMYAIKTQVAHLEEDVSAVRSDHFMRTLLHEIGHGTFQRELLKGQLEEVTNKGKVDSTVLSEAEQGKFSEDGMLFFKAWEVLRQNSAERMFGVDLGTDGTTGAERKNYQAATFSEFCAESFMHMAVEEAGLSTFVVNLARKPTTPREVIVAWRDVLRILLKYKNIINKQPG